MDFHLRKVGRPFFEDPNAQCPVGATVSFSTTYAAGFDFFMASPSADEVEAVAGGQVEFAMIEEPSVLLLFMRFSRPGHPGEIVIPWQDIPWQATRDQNPGFPEVTSPESRYFPPITLIDSTTGLVMALHKTTLSAEMTWALRDAVERQIARRAPDAEADRTLNALYERYPDNDLLVADRAQYTCIGGD